MERSDTMMTCVLALEAKKVRGIWILTDMIWTAVAHEPRRGLSVLLTAVWTLSGAGSCAH